jgi:hypothetical protein
LKYNENEGFYLDDEGLAIGEEQRHEGAHHRRLITMKSRDTEREIIRIRQTQEALRDGKTQREEQIATDHIAERFMGKRCDFHERIG